ncbi:MAG: protoporphyrinogen oxidase [Deltaproteobacteria bacterium]|nr:protoporphyrinogen oxidase [Deltaproteobacteria bacterium]
MKTVAIIGGGISGLAVAEAARRHAAELGFELRTVVLEAEAGAGGKIGTIRDGGYVIEKGPHGFLDKEPKAMALIDRLGLRASLLPADAAAETRYIVRGGRLRALPSSPPAFITSDVLPLFGKLRVMLEPLIAKKSDASEESVWAFAARRIGKPAADILVDAMVTGIYGGDPKRLSVQAAFPLLADLERKHGGLIRGQIAKAREAKRLGSGGPSMGGPRGVLHSFRAGLAELIDALASGSSLELGFRARRIELRTGGGFRVAAEDGRAIDADAVVVTAPADAMAELVRPFGEAEAESLRSIRYVPVVVVVHAFMRDAITGPAEGFGFLAPNLEGREILGSIWASSVFRGHAPEGQVMLRTLLGGARRPELADGDDATLAARAKRELTALIGLRADAPPQLERVIRWPRAIPQYELGHGARVVAAEALEARTSGLFLGGNALRGVAMIQCVADADRVAARAADWLARQ